MNVSYKIQGTKTIKKLAVRFYHNKLDLSVATNMMLTDDDWDSENQSVRNNNLVNIALQELKVDILKEYNKGFCSGVIIDKKWLSKVVETSFMRPKNEVKLRSDDNMIYVVDFALFWLDNHASKWRVSSKKFMDVPLQNQYRRFVDVLEGYENLVNERLQLRNVKIEDINSFVEYLETEDYQTSTIKRFVSRFKFFMLRASEQDIEISNSFKQRIYFNEEDDIDGIYLNEDEIQLIIDLDLSHDYNLSIVKENFLIGLHTGLRLSDLMILDTSNIREGFLKIKTKKTGTNVVLPLHPIVKSILNSNFGNLPPKVSAAEFNKSIKTICQLAKIDNMVYGKLFDKDLKRKKIGYFKKYQLVSSHFCRKSFTSNNYGKVDNLVLNSALGWSKDSKMVQKYNKTSKMEYAEKLNNQWNNK